MKTKKLLYGVGLNDTKGQSQTAAYQCWASMLNRCYASISRKERPTYEDCSVCDDWLTFSSFKAWFDRCNVEGWHLDKDLLTPGNKVYSPYTCLFIPRGLNYFANSNARQRGDLPLGVHAMNGRYEAGIRESGKRRHIGYFDTPQEAHSAWHDEKMKIAAGYKPLCDNIHPQLFRGLIETIKGLRANK